MRRTPISAGYGIGHHGRIDVYRSTPSHVVPGMYFDTASLKNFQYVGRAGIAAGRFRPYADRTGKRIEGIAEAPTGVEIGELKPAAKPMLEAGVTQVNHYIAGLRDAATLTNKWAENAGLDKSQRWKLRDIRRLPADAFTIGPASLASSSSPM